MHDNWKELALDLQLDNEALSVKLHKAEQKLANAKLDLRFANEKLRGRSLSTVPVDVGDEEFECEYCNFRLETEWWACPGCGNRIDWENARDAEGNWYAEEGEDFLSREVYEPLREAMR